MAAGSICRLGFGWAIGCGVRKTFTFWVGLGWEVVLELDGHLRQGLEDPIAKATFFKMVAEIAMDDLPECPGGDPADFLAAHHGEGPAHGGDVQQDGRGTLRLGKIPLPEHRLRLFLRIVAGVSVDKQADPGPRVSIHPRQGGCDLCALRGRQEAAAAKGGEEPHGSGARPEDRGVIPRGHASYPPAGVSNRRRSHGSSRYIETRKVQASGY